MKDSGVEWIGEIPEDWEVTKNKYIFEQKKQIVGSDWENYQLLSLTTGGIIEKDINNLQGKLPESFGTYQVVEKDDLILCLFDLDMSAVFNSKSLFDGMISPAYRRYKLKVEGSINYYNYLFDYIFVDRKYTSYSTTLRFTLDNDEFGDIPTIVPSKSEQIKIAKFLDEKINIVNYNIIKITDEILKLKEYKKSIITETVIKGLDRDVPMKDSGIEWIGEIPEHWLSSRIQYESWVRARLGWKGLKSEEYTDNGYPLLSAFNIKNDKLDWHSEVKFINKTRFDESPEIKLNIGDVLLLKDGAGIGKCARIDNLPLGESTTNSSLAVITPNKSLDYKYLYYYLLSGIFKNFTNRVLNGMGVPHLTQEEIKKIKIPVPPIKEQKKISDYLDLRTSDIDAILLKKQTQIQNLEEYKKCLIYEYVTGKKEVDRG